ncbi:hypothetical protein ABZ639_26755 [Saccharomonospora sp. NPDC006951]
MDPNWRYFGYDINRLRQNLSGDGITQYVPGYSVTYSAYWNEGKPPGQELSPPYLSPDAQTPAPDSEAAQSLEIEMIRDRIMGEQPGTTSDRATQWSRVEVMLFFVQNDLFHQTDSLGAEWESPSAKEAYLLKVGETLAHIEVWREAAEANSAALYSLASAMRGAQEKMGDLWDRYEQAIWRAAENYLNSPPALGPAVPVSPYAAVSDEKVEQEIAGIIDGQRWDLPYLREARHTYNTEARQLISETANSYASAISKLETARANRMVPMDAILHPEATGIELPSMPPGGGPGGFGGPVPTPPGGFSAAPTFNIPVTPVAPVTPPLPAPPAFAGARPPAASPATPGAPSPVPPTTTPRTSRATTPAPATPPTSVRTITSPAPGSGFGQHLSGTPVPGTAAGAPPTLGTGSSPPPPPAGGFPGKTSPAGGGKPGNTVPPPTGATPRKPKQGKVIGDRPGTPAGSLSPALEHRRAFRAPSSPVSPVLGTSDSTKKRARSQAAAEAREQDRIPFAPGATPPVLSGARTKRKPPADRQRQRPFSHTAVPAEFEVSTGTTSVFEGRLAEQESHNDRRPLGEVPAPLRRPAVTVAEHHRHRALQADRTTRSVQRRADEVTSRPEKPGDSWDVGTPGGPVVSSTTGDGYRAEPKKVLGT